MATRRYVLSVDQGTTSSRATVLDAKLRVCGVGQKEFTQHFPKSGWVEHDLNEIWSTTEWCIAAALRKAGIKGSEIAAIGITNQRETTGVWHRGTGKPLHKAIVWQDRRTSLYCAELKAHGHEAKVRETTGLVLDPYFSGTKLKWILDEVKGARERARAGELCFGTIDTWLVYKMTGHQQHVTDVSNASRTLLMNLKTLQWDDEMVSLLEVPREVLPRIAGSAEVYGLTHGMKSLPDGIPVSGMAGDQQAALAREHRHAAAVRERGRDHEAEGRGAAEAHHAPGGLHLAAGEAEARRDVRRSDDRLHLLRRRWPRPRGGGQRAGAQRHGVADARRRVAEDSADDREEAAREAAEAVDERAVCRDRAAK